MVTINLKVTPKWLRSIWKWIVSILSFRIGEKKFISLDTKTQRKILVLDLDETLVHSTTREMSHPDTTIMNVQIPGQEMLVFYVVKRPHVDLFIDEVCKWYEVVIFTASVKQYANPVIDQLDQKQQIKRRLFRESCIHRGGSSYVKDLSSIHSDLSQIIIIDNSPVSYSLNKENAIPISNWLGDNPKDDSLLCLLPFLNALQHTTDVRSILSLKDLK